MLTNLATEKEAASTTTSVIFPCTVAQRRNWTLDRARSGDPTLNIAARWRLEGFISPSLLERSLQMVVSRHETLRTAFVERKGVPVQVVMASAPFSLPLIDLTGFSETERLVVAADKARNEARRPFDLACPPLLRATLVRLGPMLCELLVTTHHLVGDCWSNGILAQEMADIYEALCRGTTPSLPVLEMQYGDYARWQKAWLDQGGADRAEAYWNRQLANLPRFHVPIDHEAPAQSAGLGDIMGMPVPRALSDAAQGLAQARGATFFMLGVATMAALLHCWTGATEVVFGTQVAGRDELELEALVGHFVNTVVLRIKMAPMSSFASLLDNVREVVGDALEHAAAPIENLLGNLISDGGIVERRFPAVAVNFLIQRAFTKDSAHGSFVLKGVPNVSPGARHDLNLFLVERPDGWRASCEFDPELLERPRIDWLLHSFLRILEIASLDPSCQIGSFALSCEPIKSDKPLDTEATLAFLWGRVLHQNAVPHDANFFTLGGDSVRAVQMLALTKQTFGRSVSLGQLFRAPTVAAMAALLRDDVEASPSGVVWVQPDGHKPPIFAINNTGIFHALAQHLGPEQPFAAVQALDPDVSPSLHPAKFQDIAGRYLEVIRNVRPHGPYCLIGLCAAGKVAFEVARQLAAAGEEVRFLAVVDSWAPGHFQKMAALRRIRARTSLRMIRLGRQIQRIREGTLSLRGFIANRAAVRGVRNAIFAWLRHTGRRDDVPPGVQNNLFVNFLDNAARRYVPRPYPGNMLVLYGPEQPRGRGLDPSFGWEALVAGDVNLVPVPADKRTAFVDHHQGLFQDPGARVMADAIKLALSVNSRG